MRNIIVTSLTALSGFNMMTGQESCKCTTCHLKKVTNVSLFTRKEDKRDKKREERRAEEL